MKLPPISTATWHDQIMQSFNLRGEALDNSVTAEGQARAQAQAKAEVRKAQAQICDRCGKPSFSNLPHCAACHRELWS